ncbi:oxidoreductase [Gilliamella sp. wkB178]|uniref:NADH:flavin oxidoreductase/NADH oxidase n=1 Tax=Gilliamella sp. wkB178 TaxID=3120259 RepID=UPI00080DB1D3|nr:NADH:flavin oxidoreductase/NADH oxidase [Gilliamella apicola]OCG06941.1 oxidoreductase [Gilliamella apicola]
MSQLFSPISIGNQSLNNRIVIPPMCQYSAENGLANNWHLMHYGTLSNSGAGLMILEATAVCPVGRLSPFDLGLWGNEQQQSIATLISNIRQYSAIPIAIQLVHAGRKGSMPPSWKPKQYIPPQQGGWQTVAPSGIAYNENYNTPHALTKDEIRVIVKQFAQAAVRADLAGVDFIEIHAAHGYLIHQFLSPLTNKRTDEYGGSFANRIRFLLEIYQSIREQFSIKKDVGIRISATDWYEGGWNLDESIQLAEKLDALQCSYIHVSTGGLVENQQIQLGPNYQVPFAQAVKQRVTMPVITVGLITEAIQAEAIVSTKQADMVAVGRALAFDPHWVRQAAIKLGGKTSIPPQYLSSVPHGFKNLFID